MSRINPQSVRHGAQEASSQLQPHARQAAGSHRRGSLGRPLSLPVGPVFQALVSGLQDYSVTKWKGTVWKPVRLPNWTRVGCHMQDSGVRSRTIMS